VPDLGKKGKITFYPKVHYKNMFFTQKDVYRHFCQSHLGRCQQGSLDKWLLACVFEMVPHSADVTMAAHQTEEESWWEK